MCGFASCREVQFTNSIEDLVMLDGTKEVMTAMVRRQERSGSVLNLLLHGAPGTGKHFVSNLNSIALDR